MNDPFGVAVGVAVIGAGTAGGVLFAFSAFVMRGLVRLPSAVGIGAMQSINVTAVTPPFMAVFFGTGLLQVSLAVWALAEPATLRPWWIVGGTALYLIGVIGVTAVVHVPKNNVLAAVRVDAAEAGATWHRYHLTWTRWNHVRCVAALGSAACLLCALAGGA